MAVKSNFLNHLEINVLISSWGGSTHKEIAESFEISKSYVSSTLTHIWKKIYWHKKHGLTHVSHSVALRLKEKKLTSRTAVLRAIKNGWDWRCEWIKAKDFLRHLGYLNIDESHIIHQIVKRQAEYGVI